MRLQIYGQLGCIPAVLDDDADQEEIKRIIDIAMNVPQGNGSNKTYKQEERYGNYNNTTDR